VPATARPHGLDSQAPTEATPPDPERDEQDGGHDDHPKHDQKLRHEPVQPRFETGQPVVQPGRKRDPPADRPSERA
jgi:hypothetical protein